MLRKFFKRPDLFHSGILLLFDYYVSDYVLNNFETAPSRKFNQLTGGYMEKWFCWKVKLWL